MKSASSSKESLTVPECGSTGIVISANSYNSPATLIVIFPCSIDLREPSKSVIPILGVTQLMESTSKSSGKEPPSSTIHHSISRTRSLDG